MLISFFLQCIAIIAFAFIMQKHAKLIFPRAVPLVFTRLVRLLASLCLIISFLLIFKDKQSALASIYWLLTLSLCIVSTGLSISVLEHRKRQK